MKALPASPSRFQVTTRVWRTELSRALGRAATLDDMPDAELDFLDLIKPCHSLLYRPSPGARQFLAFNERSCHGVPDMQTLPLRRAGRQATASRRAGRAAQRCLRLSTRA